MERAQEIRTQIQRVGVVAILRGDFGDHMVELGEALLSGGIKAIEVTLNSPGALASIRKLHEALGNRALIGAGTVMTQDEVEAALAHGAEFIVAPDTNPAVVATCRERDRAVIPGALSANEVVTAWRLGATMVKLFPAGLLGPAYVHALRGPLANIPLVPTGGVELDNVAGFIEAGAVAVGVGGSLLNQQAKNDLNKLVAKAAAFVEQVAIARRPAD